MGLDIASRRVQPTTTVQPGHKISARQYRTACLCSKGGTGPGPRPTDSIHDWLSNVADEHREWGRKLMRKGDKVKGDVRAKVDMPAKVDALSASEPSERQPTPLPRPEPVAAAKAPVAAAEVQLPPARLTPGQERTTTSSSPSSRSGTTTVPPPTTYDNIAAKSRSGSPSPSPSRPPTPNAHHQPVQPIPHYSEGRSADYGTPEYDNEPDDLGYTMHPSSKRGPSRVKPHSGLEAQDAADYEQRLRDAEFSQSGLSSDDEDVGVATTELAEAIARQRERARSIRQARRQGTAQTSSGAAATKPSAATAAATKSGPAIAAAPPAPAAAAEKQALTAATAMEKQALAAATAAEKQQRAPAPAMKKQAPAAAAEEQAPAAAPQAKQEAMTALSPAPRDGQPGSAGTAPPSAAGSVVPSPAPPRPVADATAVPMPSPASTTAPPVRTVESAHAPQAGTLLRTPVAPPSSHSVAASMHLNIGPSKPSQEGVSAAASDKGSDSQQVQSGSPLVMAAEVLANDIEQEEKEQEVAQQAYQHVSQLPNRFLHTQFLEPLSADSLELAATLLQQWQALHNKGAEASARTLSTASLDELLEEVEQQVRAAEDSASKRSVALPLPTAQQGEAAQHGGTKGAEEDEALCAALGVPATEYQQEQARKLRYAQTHERRPDAISL